MSNQRIDLNVEARETGRASSRALRVARRIPAVVYGSLEPANISLEENAVIKYNTRAFENSLFKLNAKDSKLNGVVVLLKDVVVHPVTRRPQHVDLHAIDLKKAIRVNVEVRLEGKPAGLAEGGLLNVVNRTIEVECLPTEIPEFFTADISNLGVGDALHVSDLTLPSGLKVLSTPETTIAVVNLFVEEALTPAADAAAPADGAAPAAGAAAPAAGAAAPAAGAAAPAAAKK